jgi:hypothetical protein
MDNGNRPQVVSSTTRGHFVGIECVFPRSARGGAGAKEERSRCITYPTSGTILGRDSCGSGRSLQRTS